MSSVNAFKEHAVYVPLILFIEYELRWCGGVKLKTEVREGPKNATQWYTWAEQEMDQWGDETEL
jgi:hypothetical protein